MSEFKPATKQVGAVSIALAGASGSGKTKSALELAVGLAGPDGKIGLIDTEGNRALHYARQYKFDHMDFRPPYNPKRFTETIAKARQAYSVVVVDSASDEYEGEGGLGDMAAAEGAWIKTKAQHKQHLIRHIRMTPGIVIFCLRAEEKVKFEKGGDGKVKVTPMGWMPICEKRFMYDMTLSLTLSPETPGLPRFDLPRKIGDDFLPMFSEKRRIDRRVGELIRAWAMDTDAPPAGDKAVEIVDGLIAKLEGSTTEEQIDAHLGTELAKTQIKWLMAKRPEEHTRLYDAVKEARTRVNDEPAGDGEPGGEA